MHREASKERGLGLNFTNSAAAGNSPTHECQRPPSPARPAAATAAAAAAAGSSWLAALARGAEAQGSREAGAAGWAAADARPLGVPGVGDQ